MMPATVDRLVPAAEQLALVAPGHGSHHPRMREFVAARRPDLLELALAELGEDPYARLDAGTAYAQPAIYCASVAALGELPSDAVPSVMAGHSLGEFAILVAAGGLDAADGLRLVVLRGRLSQAAAEAAAGGMVALRAPLAIAAEIAARHGLAVAGENAPTQTALSGTAERLEAAVADARSRRIRATRLPIDVPFHSPAMAPAAAAMAAALAQVEFRDPRVPVLSGIDAEPLAEPRRQLAEALVRPVRWRAVMEAFRARGVGRIVETGPGQILVGLARRTLPEVEARSLDSAMAAAR
jgi:[acyl-carrier-protein] S-malonyltransferase